MIIDYGAKLPPGYNTGTLERCKRSDNVSILWG